MYPLTCTRYDKRIKTKKKTFFTSHPVDMARARESISPSSVLLLVSPKMTTKKKKKANWTRLILDFDGKSG